MERRILAFAGSVVAIEYEGPVAAGVIDFLFGAMPEPENPPGESLATYRLSRGNGPDRLILRRDGIQIYEGNREGFAADLLLARSSSDLAEKSTGGLLFHAAALELNGGMLLAPAGTGGGKSTFTLWLTTRGYGYLTDEAVYVPEGSDVACPFIRPLSLKRPSRSVLEASFDFTGNADQVLPSSESDLIRPSALTRASGKTGLPVRHIIFPRYRPEASFAWEPLTPARTGQELMQCLVNARNLPGHGFSEVVRLAKGSKGYRATYSHLDQIAGKIDEVLGETGPGV
jgi:hypothetical protein